MKKTAMIGIGNILCRDDGVGIYLINILQNEDFLPDVALVDGGTATLDTLSYFLDYDKIIIIDCLKGGCPPGTIFRIKPEEITHFQKETLSIHDVQILDVIKMASLLGRNPEVIILGIEPEDISLGLELTPSILSKIPIYIKYVKQELAEL